MKNPDTVFFGKLPAPRAGRSVICSPTLSISRASPGSKYSFSLRGFGRTTRPALLMMSRVFILVEECGSTPEHRIRLSGGYLFFRFLALFLALLHGFHAFFASL